MTKVTVSPASALVRSLSTGLPGAGERVEPPLLVAEIPFVSSISGARTLNWTGLTSEACVLVVFSVDATNRFVSDNESANGSSSTVIAMSTARVCAVVVLTSGHSIRSELVPVMRVIEVGVNPNVSVAARVISTPNVKFNELTSNTGSGKKSSKATLEVSPDGMSISSR